MTLPTAVEVAAEPEQAVNLTFPFDIESEKSVARKSGALIDGGSLDLDGMWALLQRL